MGQKEINDDSYKTNHKCQYTGLPVYSDRCDCFIHNQQRHTVYVKPLRRSNSHDVLGIEPPLTLESLKKAYHKLCRVYHPDKPTGDHNQFIKINNAYNELLITY